jgi:argininosuccinate synthase
VTVIAPWREWEFQGRPDLIAYAKKHGIEIARGKEQDAPFSIDANLLHTSSEGLVLEDPELSVPDIVSKRADRRTITPEEAPDKATIIEVGFERGDAVSINGKKMSPATLLTELNKIGGANGVGGLDLVENRYVGMKSRGYYETPGGTILWHAHRAIESITLDRGAMHLKDELMPRYATLIYNGMWFTPERDMLQAAIDKSQDFVTGVVKLKIYKGGVSTVGRSSPYSLYNKELVGFDSAGGYNQADAEGFIKLNALRLRIKAERDRKVGKND